MDSEIYTELRRSLAEERLVALVTVVGGAEELLGNQLLIWGDGTTRGSLGASELLKEVRGRAAEAFRTLASARFEVSVGEDRADLFLEVHAPRKKLVIVGAVHVAIPLVTLAKELGFRTYVVDPRTAFATRERFSHADEILDLWPEEALATIGLDESTYLALLSHDLKLDVPAIRSALRSPARYIGALGSKKTHAKRLAALREEGLPEEDLATIHNPIGFDLGGRRAEEMALAILAEIVAASHGRGLKRGTPEPR